MICARFARSEDGLLRIDSSIPAYLPHPLAGEARRGDDVALPFAGPGGDDDRRGQGVARYVPPSPRRLDLPFRRQLGPLDVADGTLVAAHSISERIDHMAIVRYVCFAK
jgi:hypothetical protein